MTSPANEGLETLARAVRLHIVQQAAATSQVPQAQAIAQALGRPIEAIREALRHLAANRALVLAPHDGSIWSAPPFCAVPTGFRVSAGARRYWAMCIWDALGISAALGAGATIRALCGDCGEELVLEVRDGKLSRQEGVIHFAVPALRWWDNIGFT